MKQENKSLNQQVELQSLSGLQKDPIVEQMEQMNLPITRRNYIGLSWGDRNYEPTPEEEELIPEVLKK